MITHDHLCTIQKFFSPQTQRDSSFLHLPVLSMHLRPGELVVGRDVLSYAFVTTVGVNTAVLRQKRDKPVLGA